MVTKQCQKSKTRAKQDKNCIDKTIVFDTIVDRKNVRGETNENLVSF